MEVQVFKFIIKIPNQENKVQAPIVQYQDYKVKLAISK